MSLRDALDLYDAVIDLPQVARQAALDAADAEARRMALEMLAVETNSIRFREAVGWKVQSGMRELLDDPQELPQDLPGFRVLGVLGKGGMGRVLDAEQQAPKRRVALKLIHPWVDSPGARAWLRDEAQALGALLHPNIPQVYAFQETKRVSFLVMEKVEGVSLMRWAQDHGPLVRVEVMTQVVQAVAHAHARGFLHLDLKPGNILVTAENQAKVLDFGLSRTLDQAEDGTAGGTPAYMAPEQAAGGRLDVRADVFSLGAVLWAVLRCERPPGGVLPPLWDEEHSGSPELAAIAQRAAHPDPEQRYPSVEAMLADLQAYLELRPVQAYAGGSLYRVGKSLRRRPALWALSSIALLSLLAGTAVSVDRAQQAEAARLEAVEALAAAEEARVQSEADAARARASSEFLTEVFLELNPRRTTGQKTLVDAGNAAMRRLDEGALAEAPEEANKLRLALGDAWMNQGDTETAWALSETVVASYGEGGLPVDEHYVVALHQQMTMASWDRDQDTIITVFPKALAAAVQIGDEGLQAELLHTRAYSLSRLGDYAGAEELFTQAYARKLLLEDELPFYMITNTMNQLGYLRYMQGDYDGSLEVFERLIVMAQAEGPEGLGTQATAYHWLAQFALDRGEYQLALEELDKTMAIRDELGISYDVASRSGELVTRTKILIGLGDVAGARLAWDTFVLHRETTGPFYRNDAKALESLLVAEGRMDEAQRTVDAAYARDIRSVERSGSWAWAYTTRGLWRARTGQPGARQDIENAISVWEPRFGPKSPRVVELKTALAGLPEEG